MLLDMNELVRNDLDRVVAVEPENDGTATIYRRLENGGIEKAQLPFKPWLLVTSLDVAECFANTADEVVALDGDGVFRFMVIFPDVKAYETGLKDIKKATGKSPSAPGAPYRLFSDFTQQFLSIYPARLFGRMRFDELRRMQLDIETRSVGEKHFPDAKRPDDAIIMVSLKDSSGWEDCLVLENDDEKALLQRMVQVICERDPDVIEGHNIFNFDLSYIVTRCKLHKVKFAIGRDGSEPSKRESRLTAGERIVPFTRFDVYGRHIVDSLHLVYLYDAIHRDMESHGLKYVAKYFGVASEERTYVDGSDITNLFTMDREKLIAYCLDDARETDAICKILSPSYFYQAQLVPLSYQSCVTRGNATRIDAMLCAEYLLGRTSLPVPHPAVQIQGALTEGDKAGVFNNVWHVDVRSLYPSIITARHLTPRVDSKGVFLHLLTELRRFRLAAKDARKHASEEEKRYYDTLQSTFKILINAFYGYTAFAQGTFNDFELASQITSTGRAILSSMKDFLEGIGATIIEMDTDGIYFKPSEHQEQTQSNIEDMQNRIQEILPEGIEIEIDATYEAMFGYKSKNYALLHKDGRITMSGAALKSRGLEPFQRRYIRELLTLMLTGKASEIDKLYDKYANDIETHALPISDFAKREYLSTSLDTYSAKLARGETKRSAAYDLAIQSGHSFAQGDPVEFYVIGSKKTLPVIGNSKLLSDAPVGERDENVPFYLAKLRQLHEKITAG